MFDLGPQSGSDSNAFTRRMRLHQSWWRAAVLGVPCGTGPTPAAVTHIGNMLDEPAADAGANYLTPEIHRVALDRIARGSGVEAFRCHRNLLSSQPMCFNLFGPLCLERPERNAALLDAMVPEPVAKVTDAKIEWDAGGLIGDRSSFDAFISYETPDGLGAFLGVETKLTEPFSQTNEDPARYEASFSAARSVWVPEATIDRIADKRWFQLWRNHLLVEALSRELSIPGRVAIVYHPLDVAATQAVDGYTSLLSNPSRSLLDLPLDRLLDLWGPVANEHGDHEWSRLLTARYLALELSAAHWDRWLALGA